MECKPCIILITRLNQKHVLRFTRIYIIYIITLYRLPLLPKAIIYPISKIWIKFYSTVRTNTRPIKCTNLDLPPLFINFVYLNKSV